MTTEQDFLNSTKSNARVCIRFANLWILMHVILITLEYKKTRCILDLEFDLFAVGVRQLSDEGSMMAMMHMWSIWFNFVF